MDLGQLFMLGFTGTTVDEDHWLALAIRKHHLGGVILFDRNVDGSMQNISSPDQLKRLTATLQQYAGGSLLIAVDQEGGQVARLKERDGFPATLSAQAFADCPDDEKKDVAGHMARTLADHGVNFNLAPVVDLDLNPENPIIGRYQRSFGRDPEQVIAAARIFIEAHHTNGVACCLKHFPGHGSAAADTHLGFVDISNDWQGRELIPFGRLIAAGMADAVMTAHVVQHHLDPEEVPATMSRPVVTGLLRKKLGFTGIAMSDDLQMGAITEKWGYAEAVRRAILAGIDLLVIGNNLQVREDGLSVGIRVIEDMLDRGEIDVHYIESSLERIARLQKKISGETPWMSNGPITLS